MRIHDRYVLTLYLKILFFCIVAFTMLFILIDVSEKIGGFLDDKAQSNDIFLYFLFYIPEIIRLTLPVDVLLATMLTLGVLGRNNELVALMLGGVSLLRATLPVILCSLLLVTASWYLSEILVPVTNREMNHIKRVEIEKKAPLDHPIRHNFSYYGRKGYLYVARSYDTKKQVLSDVTVTFSQEGKVSARVDARRGHWSRGMWILHDGYYRTFQGTEVNSEYFLEMNFPELKETPEELARIKPEPEAMNFADLQEHVNRVQASGIDVSNYRVDLYSKISYPFSILIMCLLGIGISAAKRKTTLASGFIQTLAIAFVYLLLIEVAMAFGKTERLTPLVAAWITPVLFASISGVFLMRVNR